MSFYCFALATSVSLFSIEKRDVEVMMLGHQDSPQMAEEEIALPEDEEEILAEPNEYSTEYGSVSGQGISLANSEGTWSKGSLSQIKSEMKKKTFYMGVLLSLVFTFSFFVFLPFGDRFFLYTLTNATAVVCFLMLVVFGISPFFYCEGFFLPVSSTSMIARHRL